MRHIYSALVAIGRSAWRAIEVAARRLRVLGALAVLAIALASCGGDEIAPSNSIPLGVPSERPAVRLPAQVSEASPPKLIQRLRSRLDRFRPQVAIVEPRAGSIIEDSSVTVSLSASGLPIFRDERFGLGPHVHLLLDDREVRSVFDLDKPIAFENLAPGTHTLRAFAVRPWSESFKNDGAFAQTTFHIFTKTGKNEPDPSLPLLTYNEPSGTYGAEPILLDFYLTNAPLHAIAREFDDDDVRDWRVRVTVNGQSFSIDRWEPIYLKGVKPGRNWLQIELLDETGEPIENAFNSTVRIFEYDPELNDGLAEIVRGDVDLAEALSAIGVEPEPEPAIESEVESEAVEPESEAKSEPSEESSDEPEAIAPPEPASDIEPDVVESDVAEMSDTEAEAQPEAEPTALDEPIELEETSSGSEAETEATIEPEIVDMEAAEEAEPEEVEPEIAPEVEPETIEATDAAPEAETEPAAPAEIDESESEPVADELEPEAADREEALPAQETEPATALFDADELENSPAESTEVESAEQPEPADDGDTGEPEAEDNGGSYDSDAGTIAPEDIESEA